MNNLILFNDTFIPRNEARVDIDDRGYQFGDGIYEVVRLYDGEPFLMDEHLVRLERSATELGMSLGFSRQALSARLDELFQKTGVGTGTVYIQVTRGVHPRVQEFPPADLPVQWLAYCRELARPSEKLKNGVSVALTPDIRWLRCDIKSVNLLPNILGRQAATGKGCYEAVQHRDGIVTEGAFSNVYRIANGTVFTHPANNFILNGVTRRKILELCEEAGIPVREETFSTDELLAADEVFLTSTTNEVMPVVAIDGQAVGNGSPGELTCRLQDLYEAAIFSRIG